MQTSFKMTDITKKACLHRLSYMKYGIVIETEKMAYYIYLHMKITLHGGLVQEGSQCERILHMGIDGQHGNGIGLQCSIRA